MGLSYRDAGVDIDKKGSMLRNVGERVKTTFGPRVLHTLGAFGGMYAARFPELDDPILVASNDGVGTKVRTALRAGRPRGLGHDIVNHCVNDILVQGAEPLFFLDYFASSHLDPAVFDEVLEGLVEACAACGAALLGGETAEMPGTYVPGELDLVGCIVGLVDRKHVWPRDVEPGLTLVGVRSDGLHTNGYSLVNRLLDERDIDPSQRPEGGDETLADALCRPHRSYLTPVLSLRNSVDVRAVAHITGGGLQDNVPRVLPQGVGARIDRSTWRPNAVFEWILDNADMDRDEAYHVFNMGCGLVLAVPESDTARTLDALHAAGEDAWVMGETVAGEGVAFTQ